MERRNINKKFLDRKKKKSSFLWVDPLFLGKQYGAYVPILPFGTDCKNYIGSRCLRVTRTDIRFMGRSGHRLRSGDGTHRVLRLHLLQANVIDWDPLNTGLMQRMLDLAMYPN